MRAQGLRGGLQEVMVRVLQVLKGRGEGRDEALCHRRVRFLCLLHLGLNRARDLKVEG